MKNSRILKNSFYSVLQTIVMSLVTLIIYKLLIFTFGLKETGIWSYLSSILTITGLGSFGFASSLVYFIPKYSVAGDNKNVKELINTSFIFTVLFTSLLCLIAYIIFYNIIPHTIETKYLVTAFKMLPVVVFSFFFSGISSTYLAVLDGIGSMHIRSKIIIAGSLLYIILCFSLIGKYGLLAIPIAEAFKNIFLTIIGFIVIKKQLPFYSLSLNFNKDLAKLIFKYGFNFQIISITQIVSDPFIKSMITKFGGSANTAIFDICLRILTALRALIIAANQSVAPQITIFKTRSQLSRIKVFYKANFRLVGLFAVVLLLGPLMFSDILAYFFLGKHDFNFNFIFCNLSIALLINTISSPAHFTYTGTGNLRWTVLNNVIAAVLMFIMAPLIGNFMGDKYIVLGWSIPTIIGSSVMIYNFGKQNKLSASDEFGQDNTIITAAIVIATIFNFYLNDKVNSFKLSIEALIGLNILIAIVFTFPAIWRSRILQKMLKKNIFIRRK